MSELHFLEPLSTFVVRNVLPVVHPVHSTGPLMGNSTGRPSAAVLIYLKTVSHNRLAFRRGVTVKPFHMTLYYIVFGLYGLSNLIYIAFGGECSKPLREFTYEAP